MYSIGSVTIVTQRRATTSWPSCTVQCPGTRRLQTQIFLSMVGVIFISSEMLSGTFLCYHDISYRHCPMVASYLWSLDSKLYLIADKETRLRERQKGTSAINLVTLSSFLCLPLLLNIICIISRSHGYWLVNYLIAGFRHITVVV